MADTPVSPPTTVAPTTAPNRTTATDPLVYSQIADAWAASIVPWNVYLTELGVNVKFNADSAFASAEEAQASSLAATASANFIGDWEDQTGAKTVPTSVRHVNRVWRLLNNIADITASEPGISADWAAIGTLSVDARTTNQVLTPADFGLILKYTSGTFNQTLELASTMGLGWFVWGYNTGTGIITLDPAGSDTITGTDTIYPGDLVAIICNGVSDFEVIKLNSNDVNSEVVVVTGNGSGSTNSKIRRFSTIKKNVGNGVTYAESAADGASFTINHPGRYAIVYTDAFAGGGSAFGLGISVNSDQLTTSIQSIDEDDRVNHAIGASSTVGTVTATNYFEAGDVIRPHNGTTVPNSTTVAETRFSIIKVG